MLLSCCKTTVAELGTTTPPDGTVVDCQHCGAVLTYWMEDWEQWTPTAEADRYRTRGYKAGYEKGKDYANDLLRESRLFLLSPNCPADCLDEANALLVKIEEHLGLSQLS